MNAPTPRWRILLLVAAVLMAFVVFAKSLHRQTTAQDVVQPVSRPQHHAIATGKSVEPTAMLSLKRRERSLSSKSAGDLFKPKSWYVPPPPPPPVPPPPPTAPPLPFTFIGKVDNAGEPLTIVLSGNDRVYLVKEGDTIDSTYHVDGIMGGQIVLTYLPLQIQQYLTMGDAP